MKKNLLRSLSSLEQYRRALSGAIVVVLMANLVVAAQHAPRANDTALRLDDNPATVVDGSTTTSDPGVSKAATTPGAKSSALPSTVPVKKGNLIGKFIPGVGTKPPGIDANTIKVSYYWKGDQTMTSQFIAGTGAEGHDLDEADAFYKLIAYLNKHKNGGATFMGFPFNLHGRTIVGKVEEAGKSTETENEAVNRMKDFGPFAAISSHGSTSIGICPQLARVGIHNFSTFDLGGVFTGTRKQGTLLARTNGYCLPSGLSFEQQLELSIKYLVQRTNKTTTTAGQKRVYGVVYAEYNGLIDVIDSVVAKLRAAGLNIPKNGVVSLPKDLTIAQTVAANRVDQLSKAGVNTIIAPESGSLISFTHAAQANGYSPDYYVWPCSGQDATGMVRLYDPLQWARARGLTCYDPDLNADLTKDDATRDTEWYKQYQEIAPGKEPPAPTPLVYQGLLPLVVGLTNAGRDITIEKFRAGMAAFAPYRYSAVDGKTKNPWNMLLSVGSPDGTQVADVGEVFWNPNKRTPGAEVDGAYEFTERKRYARGAVF